MDEFTLLWAVKDTKMKVWRAALKVASNADLMDARRACVQMGQFTKAKIINRELRNREKEAR